MAIVTPFNLTRNASQISLMVMPAVKSKPVRDLFKQKIFIHGFPKGGKSTLAAQFPGFAFLATEPGLNSLEAWRWEDENGNYVIDSWEKLKVATREAVDNQNCRGIIIDVVDLAYELARDYVCQQNGESYHIDGSLSYGKITPDASRRG